MLMYVVAERHVAMVTEIDWTNAWLMTTFPKHGAIKLHSVVCQSDSAPSIVSTCNSFLSGQPGKVLKEKAAAKIYFERNLYEDFCRDSECYSN